MKLYCIRHGNTFGDDQEGGKHVFMSGNKNNIPLVQKGREQARTFAQYLNSLMVIPTRLYANHLIRVWETAVIIREYFYYQRNGVSIPIIRDESLLEIDYGNWAGLTTENNHNEVIERFGKKVWDDWQDKRIIPNDPPSSWVITKDDIIVRLRDFLSKILETHHEDDVIVTVSSQGILTFLPALLNGSMEEAIAKNQYKIKTGNFCELEYDGNRWNLLNWDKIPH